jgi:tetratricopeptide (TPR) repeat protein
MKADAPEKLERQNQLGDLDASLGKLASMEAGLPLVPATLRRRFADTAAWMPNVVTGKDGSAEVKVTLPDNLTTWRAVTRGVTKATLVGEATAEVVARRDLSVRVDTPRFLVKGDKVVATATVHNDLSQPVDVRLSVEGSGQLAVDGAPVTANLKPHEIRAFDVPFTASGQGLARLKAEALTTAASDAAETGIPVLPLGLRTMVGRSGEVTEEALETFSLPAEVIPGTREMALTLSAGLDSSILESLVYLGRFPYGCLEQTVNRFLPAIAAEKALRAAGSPNVKLKDEIRKAVEQGLLALYSFQNGDGSFGWFSGNVRRVATDSKAAATADPVMTALAIMAIETAREEGYRVSYPHRDRALAAGKRLVKTTEGNAEKALLLHALSLGGAADLEDLNQVYRYRDALGSYALAHLALAMDRTKRAPNALALARLLAVKAVQKDGLTWFPGEGQHGVMNTVETTASAIRALVKIEPETGLAEGAVRWLLAHKQGAAWFSTRDTGAAVLALSDWIVAKGVGRADYEVEVWLNDATTPYQKIHVAGGKIAGDQGRAVIVDGARLKAGENRLKLVKRGPGSLYYTLSLVYWTEAEKIEPAGNLVKVERTYVEYVSPVAVREGAEEIRPGYNVVDPEARPKEAAAATIDRAGSGDKFRVRLKLSARENLPYVIVEDPLPAGVEVVEGAAKGPFDWEERRDEKQVFFVTNVPAGETEITYLVQAIHPGTYSALPTFAYPMYEPAIQGRSGLARLTVVPESGVVGRPGTSEGITPDEVYGLAVRDYKAKRYEAARDGLSRLVAGYRLLDQILESCQGMLMRSAFELGDHKGAVEAYEKLVEVNPRKGPENTRERRLLAEAYQGIGEDERSLSLMKGVIDEYFAREAEVAETYRRIGNPYEAQDFTLRLLRSYPDSNAVIDETWRTALRYLEMKRKPEEVMKAPVVGVETGLMLEEALDRFRTFLTHYPTSPIADEADVMSVTVLNRMERFGEAVEEAVRFIRRYKESVHLDDVIYYLAESFYGQGEYEKVFETGQAILDQKFRQDAGSRVKTESPFIPHVRYLFAKIHHKQGNLAKAVELYDRVDGQFEDARDALAFLTEQALKIPESATFGVGEPVKLTVSRKNLTSLELRIYPVDLMLLVAVKKDLKKASDIDLTGIATTLRSEKSWPDGRDYRWHEEEVPLSASEKGVYLVVAKSGDLSAAGLVIVSDLEVSLQVVGDKVRVYATDRRTREPAADVFVKVSDGSAIRSEGFTDARGVFEGAGAGGSLMVVAEKDGHFALVRR